MAFPLQRNVVIVHYWTHFAWKQSNKQDRLRQLTNDKQHWSQSLSNRGATKMFCCWFITIHTLHQYVYLLIAQPMELVSFTLQIASLPKHGESVRCNAGKSVKQSALKRTAERSETPHGKQRIHTVWQWLSQVPPIMYMTRFSIVCKRLSTMILKQISCAPSRHTADMQKPET